ncbi:hypothetical protein NKH99_22850 [Mesorhizobium sp. M0854]|uniref:hypothetical protein n=1 Tax=Mesorhizobium sp. M0854 TaxID=2957013 RepID=UPI003338D555
MSQSFETSRSLTALEQDNTVIAVIEMSKAKWLIAAPYRVSSASPSRRSMLTRQHC